MMGPPENRQIADNQQKTGTQRSTKASKGLTQMSSYPELSDNFGSFGGQLSNKGWLLFNFRFKLSRLKNSEISLKKNHNIY